MEEALHPMSHALLWPFEGGTDLLRDSLFALLPTRKHNVQVLEAVSRGALTHRGILPLFLADPFLHLPKTIEALRYHEVTRIAALPGVAQWGSAYCEALDGLNLGAAREAGNLAALGEAGLEVFQSCCRFDAQGVPPVRHNILIAPSFDMPMEAEPCHAAMETVAQQFVDAGCGDRVFLLEDGQRAAAHPADCLIVRPYRATV